ncbi:cell wall-binding repeat-containing protein [Peptostreptococcus porci]|uniref:cell wall-binding repeat-containing protein n=1 Tax=Peptostreptococcus porci TaxID=2652282 RepID=UPI0023F4B724|nr:cell wall-binding repeat-containing protein [Peptostreptococcus porci]MDD7182075.1 cell wall-binding repeat-containing protein [Peptostreptococcus porci]MDY4127335.1 cell wall-binding repeat-containing protein [Peptostreptococcus porci]MDY5964242.1 cell wall-binding repeat-containing protein [Peptostreptococcus porci]
MKYGKLITSTMSAVILSGIVSTSFGAEMSKKIEIERIGGKDRVETSLMIAKKMNSKAVYIASGKDFPDALSISPLAAESGIGIVLAMDNTELNKELKDMGIMTTSVIGGSNSVSDEMFKNLSKDFVSNRLYGKDRYETSEIIARGMKYFNVGIATGKNFPDALVSGPLLGKKGMAMLLIDGNKSTSLPDNFKGIYTFGGKSSVATDFGKRIAGMDRYETSEKIASEYDKYDTVILASGTNFADALAVSPLSRKLNAPILLTDGNSLSDGAKKIINSVKKVVIVGGEKSISKTLENSIFRSESESKDVKTDEKNEKNRKNEDSDKNTQKNLEKLVNEANNDKIKPSNIQATRKPVVDKIEISAFKSPAERGTTQVLNLKIEGKNLTEKEKEDLEWKILEPQDGISINDKGHLTVFRNTEAKKVTVSATTKLSGDGVENKTATTEIIIENPKQ